MKPIGTMPVHVAANIKVVLADIDDTITTEGRLTARAYGALEALKDIGIKVAPVTGRPAGWCDMIARFWPVDGVIGENGAFYYSYDSKARQMIRKYHPAMQEHINNPTRFDRIRERIKAEVPGAAISADQPFRMADLAVDFCEDVPPLTAADIKRIKSIFEEEGGVAKISSIHVNGWFGTYDKMSMSRAFVKDRLGMDIDLENDAFVFVGDSPNDAPMFAAFNQSCGVANVMDFQGSLPAEPTWVASHKGGEGFVEIAEKIIAAKTAA